MDLLAALNVTPAGKAAAFREIATAAPPAPAIHWATEMLEAIPWVNVMSGTVAHAMVDDVDAAGVGVAGVAGVGGTAGGGVALTADGSTPLLEFPPPQACTANEVAPAVRNVRNLRRD
jgi:hypothetical protein